MKEDYTQFDKQYREEAIQFILCKLLTEYWWQGEYKLVHLCCMMVIILHYLHTTDTNMQCLVILIL